MGDPDSSSLAKDPGSAQGQPSPTREETVLELGASSEESEPIKLLAEEMSVERQLVETSRVRVNLLTRERQELVDVPLAREQVVIERVPVGRRVDAIPPIREVGDTFIVPIVEEILVLERRLMLKEELHVKRVHTTERYQELVTLRYQEAVVTRTPDEAPEADTSLPPDPKLESK
jgi:uncharacterized protein (TIGR02271 family)